MKLLELLAKLGILRFGAQKGVYRNAAEKPTELMLDGVFDAKRDLAFTTDKSKPAADKTDDASVGTDKA